MLKTAVVLDPQYLNHETGHDHPERPERIKVLLDLMESCSREGIIRVAPRPAEIEEIALVHTDGHIRRVAESAKWDYFSFDADTPVCKRSYEIAKLAVGGTLELLDAIMAGKADNGFALIRPPGHHAERGQAMGFCLFNNVAIGAEYLRKKHGLERILIMDWDVHHGNGTQHIFERDPGVLYISTHQFPYYPGTGAADEVGIGEGEGFTVNIPLSEGCGDAEYLAAFEEIMDPIARQFNPQFVLISAGFDSHHRDPLGGMKVSEEGFGAMARILLRVTRDSCSSRCAAILEGGYDLSGLKNSVERILEELGSQSIDEEISIATKGGQLLKKSKIIQGRYWNLH